MTKLSSIATSFSIYSEMMMFEAVQDSEEGVSIGGERIRDVRFAADQAMIRNSKYGL